MAASLLWDPCTDQVKIPRSPTMVDISWALVNGRIMTRMNMKDRQIKERMVYAFLLSYFMSIVLSYQLENKETGRPVGV